MEAERLMGQGMAAEEDRPEVERDEKREEEKQETAEERGQLDEEAMAADQEEFHRENDRDCVEKEEDGQFRWEEWDWESRVDEVGSARGAFGPRGREDVRRHDDGQDKGGRRREDKGQDEGGWRQDRDKRSDEGDRRQDRRRGDRAQMRGDLIFRMEEETTSTLEVGTGWLPPAWQPLNKCCCQSRM